MLLEKNSWDIVQKSLKTFILKFMHTKCRRWFDVLTACTMHESLKYFLKIRNLHFTVLNVLFSESVLFHRTIFLSHETEEKVSYIIRKIVVIIFNNYATEQHFSKKYLSCVLSAEHNAVDYFSPTHLVCVSLYIKARKIERNLY